jgi:glyoxylase-like metal-dependent hydrolase (beta-lactamase superfamily II)
MSHVSAARIGRFELSPICEGWAPIALADECPGQQVDWGGERARFPWAFADEVSWAWHVHSFVVTGPSGVVLVDTGLGSFPPYTPWGETVADAWSGIDASQVRHVVLTHLHADHSGGIVDGSGEPRFPHATYHLHPGDRTAFARADDAEEYVARSAMETVEAAGMLDLTEPDHDILPGISVRHTPGHTPGHRSVLVRDGGATLLITGDVVHLPVQVANPSWASAHDEDPGLGQAARQVLLWRARHDAWRVAIPHFAHPFGRVVEGGWEPD